MSCKRGFKITKRAVLPLVMRLDALSFLIAFCLESTVARTNGNGAAVVGTATPSLPFLGGIHES
jgi:hypothetical protein